MNQRKIHRVIGLVMLLPLLAWAATGVIFLTKPGYEGAYEKLYIKAYELDSNLNISPRRGWEEIRYVKSIVGLHLLIKKDGEFVQYNPDTFLPSKPPSEKQVRMLVSDAIQLNSERYGVVDRIDGLNVYTSTGIEIKLDWNEMKLSQRGIDREIIETLYHIHYLQWTEWDSVNIVLGVVGLLCLLSLTILGLSSYISYGRKDE